MEPYNTLRWIGVILTALYLLGQLALWLWPELPLRHRARVLRALGRACLRLAEWLNKWAVNWDHWAIDAEEQLGGDGSDDRAGA